jgi:hypothetical protein
MLRGTKRECKPNWRAELSHPIVLRDGRVFETLHDASYIGGEPNLSPRYLEPLAAQCAKSRRFLR